MKKYFLLFFSCFQSAILYGQILTTDAFFESTSFFAEDTRKGCDLGIEMTPIDFYYFDDSTRISEEIVGSINTGGAWDTTTYLYNTAGDLSTVVMPFHTLTFAGQRTYQFTYDSEDRLSATDIAEIVLPTGKFNYKSSINYHYDNSGNFVSDSSFFINLGSLTEFPVWKLINTNEYFYNLKNELIEKIRSDYSINGLHRHIYTYNYHDDGYTKEIVTTYEGPSSSFSYKEEFFRNAGNLLSEKWISYPDGTDWKVDTKYLYKYTDFAKMDTILIASGDSWNYATYTTMAYNSQQLLSDSNFAEVKHHFNYDEDGRIISVDRFKYCEEVFSFINDMALKINWKKIPIPQSNTNTTNWPHPGQFQEDADLFLKVIPNPATEWMDVSWKNASQHVSFMITNSVGQLLYEQRLPTDIFHTSYKIPVKNLPNGIYFLSMRTDDQNEIAVVSVQR